MLGGVEDLTVIGQCCFFISYDYYRLNMQA